MTAGDVLIDILIEWGVDTIFGLPGDGINGIMESLRKRQDKVRFIQVRHEEAAAFAACAHAKLTGRLGCCLATSGPGAIHLLNGLYDAKLDRQSVVAVTGEPFHDLIGTFTQQDVETARLFQDVAAYSTRVMGPAHVANVTHLACRIAVAQRTVTHVSMPVDIQSLACDEDARTPRNVPKHNVALFARAAGVPAREALGHAAAILNDGNKIAILAGAGALGASDELEAIAERLGAPIIKALLGKACVPDDSPYTTGSIGLLGTRPSQEALEKCDTLLLVGTSFPYIEFYPKPGAARAVQIDIDAKSIGLRYPVEVGLLGDARATLAELLPLLGHHTDRSFLEEAQAGMVAWWKLMDERGTRSDTPMKPQVVAHELDLRLRDDAIVCCDSGTIATWFARHLRVRAGQMYTLSGTLASMAPAVPYAIAAALAFPGRQVIAYVGDGGFAMLLAELATCVKYKLDVKIVVSKNNALGQIKWEQIVFLGNPEFACELEPIDFAAVAKAFGAKGYAVSDPAQMGPTLDRALRETGPVVIECTVDPHEPPLPPKITLRQAAKFGEALVRGTAEGGDIVKTVLDDKIRELV